MSNALIIIVLLAVCKTTCRAAWWTLAPAWWFAAPCWGCCFRDDQARP